MYHMFHLIAAWHCKRPINMEMFS